MFITLYLLYHLAKYVAKLFSRCVSESYKYVKKLIWRGFQYFPNGIATAQFASILIIMTFALFVLVVCHRLCGFAWLRYGIPPRQIALILIAATMFSSFVSDGNFLFDVARTVLFPFGSLVLLDRSRRVTGRQKSNCQNKKTTYGKI